MLVEPSLAISSYDVDDELFTRCLRTFVNACCRAAVPSITTVTALYRLLHTWTSSLAWSYSNFVIQAATCASQDWRILAWFCSLQFKRRASFHLEDGAASLLLQLCYCFNHHSLRWNSIYCALHYLINFTHMVGIFICQRPVFNGVLCRQITHKHRIT